MATTAKHLVIKTAKVDAERRHVFGWASVSVDADGHDVIDHDGDHLPTDELERAVYDLMADGGGMVGAMHVVEGMGPIIESIIFTKEKNEQLTRADQTQGWWVGVHVTNESAWEKVKAGEWPEFSIAGEAERADA